MITLLGTTDKLQLVLAEAISTTNMSIYSSYKDVTSSAIAPGYSALNISSTTSDVVSAPSASTARVIDFITVTNNDVIGHNCSIVLNISSTQYTIYKNYLSPGTSMIYQNRNGFSIINYGGSKSLISSIDINNPLYTTDLFNIATVASNVVNSNSTANTLADITGLSFSVASGSMYYFRAMILHSSTVTSTGARFTVLGPGTAEGLSFTSEYDLSAGSTTRNAQVSAFSSPAAAAASVPSTSTNRAILEGFFKADASGTFSIQFASEVASSAITVLQGSTMEWKLVA